MEVIFKEIADQLKAKLATDFDLEWVDLEQGQIDMNKDNTDLVLPAIFIGFEDIKFSNKGRGDQNGNCLLNFRIVQKIYEETYDGSENQSSALDKMAFVKRVHIALQGFYGTYFNHLFRESLAQELRPDGLLVFNMKYRCNITDEITDSVGRGGTSMAVPNITGQIKTSF